MSKTTKRIIKVTTVTFTVVSVSVLLLMLVSGLMFNGWYQNRQLFEAIKNNDCNAAQKAIDRGAWINARKYILLYAPDILWFNRTPLIEACQTGNREMVELLVENGADVNKTDNFTTKSPLICALSSGSADEYKIARFLIDNGADIHYITDAGCGAVSYILYVREEDSEETVQESFEFLKYLAENEAPLSVQLGVGKENCLTYVAHYGNCNALEFFVENGIYEIDTPDGAGNTALISAAKHGCIEAVKILLEYGADVTICDSEGKTAYDHAVQNGFTEIAKLLSESTETEK